MSKDVILIGAGGHAYVIADIIKKNGDIVFGFLDDDLTKPNVIGTVADCVNYTDKYFIIAIGNNKVRKMISNKYPQLKYYTAVHPSAVIDDSVNIGIGTVVMANCVINANTNIGAHCIINTASVVEHDNFLADYVHISPNATLCGTVSVGECTHIGAAATVKNNICITNECMIGIGAAVVKNIDISGIYVGVPSQLLKNNNCVII